MNLDPEARRKQRWRAEAARNGGTTTVNPEPFIEKVRTFVAWGFPNESIARAAGLPGRTIRHLYAARPARIGRHYAPILDLTPADLIAASPDDALIPSVGMSRRFQALQVMGWSGPLLAAEGVPVVARRSDRAQTRAGTHRAVVAAYDRLSMTRGPNAAARTKALRKGWFPPLAWDDDTIDHPDAKPNVEGWDRPAYTHKSRAELRAAIAESFGRGFPASLVAREFGVSERTVHRSVAEHKQAA